MMPWVERPAAKKELPEVLVLGEQNSALVSREVDDSLISTCGYLCN